VSGVTLSREYVADLRATAGRRNADPAVRSLTDGLSAASDEFATIWARQEVAVRRTTHKVLHHPEVGRLDLQCDVVLSPPSGQRLVLFRPEPGHPHPRPPRRPRSSRRPIVPQPVPSADRPA